MSEAFSHHQTRGKRCPSYHAVLSLVKSKKGRNINGVATPEEKKLDVMDPLWHRRRAGELMERSKEALMQASRAWQRGNAKTRGGEVALTYAERARAFQEQAQEESLHAAWDMIQAKRVSLPNGSSIDLHGTTVVEAIHIVKVLLEEEAATPAKPLKIITGRGNHSVNRVGVLRPAIHTALTNEGWNVSKFDGGLVCNLFLLTTWLNEKIAVVEVFSSFGTMRGDISRSIAHREDDAGARGHMKAIQVSSSIYDGLNAFTTSCPDISYFVSRHTAKCIRVAYTTTDDPTFRG
ncbi:hypothetical protein NM688_g5237 [Phlebia brevispora]|uniref:Uncharacterized protein n=1 Tax=Phlebia brevispora TaxID=194682 RepID=A0ACC1SYJ4_9APHY|nr:hypothetical protein NM688_g5237 [Phlebia brevispora]